MNNIDGLIAEIEGKMSAIHDKTFLGGRQEYFEGKYQGYQSAIDLIRQHCDGHTLMPDEPSDAMRAAYYQSIDDHLFKKRETRHYFNNHYKAMLQASKEGE